MSNNDTNWTTSRVSGATRQAEPTATSMNVALMRSFGSCTHGGEDISYIAFDE
jgi:hypothetical protein